jgi:hypothetical protein
MAEMIEEAGTLLDFTVARIFRSGGNDQGN